MIEALILGALQGIFEWLPVSSEGLIFIVKTNFFSGSGETLEDLVSYVLFLHLGTFFAALIYFWPQVKKLLVAIFNFNKASKSTQLSLKFLIISTFISGIIGIVLLQSLEKLNFSIESGAKYLTLVVALLLFITAFLQLRGGQGGKREAEKIKVKDGIILGIVQSFAALPGLSRSGLTVSSLLMLKFNKQTALHLSFLMSLPIVLGGNIILNYKAISFNIESLLALSASFIFGLLTIKSLLILAKKINFGYFVLIFAILTLLATLLI
jgi:undecaprenyl-diphosphatase